MNSRQWNIECIKKLIKRCTEIKTKLEFCDLAGEEADRAIDNFVDVLDDIISVYDE